MSKTTSGHFCLFNYPEGGLQYGVVGIKGMWVRVEGVDSETVRRSHM